MKARNTFILIAVLVVVASYFYFVEHRGEQEQEKEERLSRKLLPYPEKEVDRVKFLPPSGEIIEWQRDGEGWLITYPTVTAGSRETIDYFLQQIVPGRKIDEFDAGGNFADYGLASPYATLILFNDFRGRSDTIYIGDKTPLKTQCYVRIGSSPDVTISRDLTRNLMQKTLYHMRDKHFLRIEPDSVVALSALSGERRIDFRKRNGVWYVGDTRIAANRELVIPYITSLTDAVIRSFVREEMSDSSYYGIGAPPRRIILATREDTIHTSFGRIEEELVYVIRTGIDKILTLEKKYAQVFEWLDRDMLVLDVTTFQPGEVTAVRYESPGRTVVLNRARNGWTISGRPGAIAASEDVSFILMMTRGLSFDRLLGRSSAFDHLLDGYTARLTLLAGPDATLDVITFSTLPSGEKVASSFSTGAAGTVMENVAGEIERRILEIADR